MKLVFVSSYYPPYTVGGAEKSTYALARAVRALGHRVDVLAPLLGPEPPQDDFTTTVDLGYRMKKPGTPLAPRVFDRLSVHARMQQALAGRLEGVEAVHAQTLDLLPAAYLAARRAGLPLIASIRDLGAVCPVNVCLLERPRVHADCGIRRLERSCVPHFRALYGGSFPRNEAAAAVRFATARGRAALLRRCDAVVSVGSDLGLLYADAGLVDPERLHHIPNIAEIPGRPAQPAPPPGGLRAGGYVAYAGKVSHGKGIRFLLEAVDLARREAPDLELAVAGRADEQWAPRLERPGVHALGRLNDQAMRGLYAGARLAVVPSIWPEPFPRAAIEAAAAGVAVVGTRAGGIPDAIDHERTGLLVEPRDAPDLAAALVRLWSDDGLRARLAEAARADAADRFSSHRVAERFERLYVALAAGRSASRTALD